ncbi:MAG: class I SAM-dependent methyltransferase [Puniceicoccaceae bacterium]
MEKNPIYATSPLEIRQGIPVFSKTDHYIENYATIARDHLESLHKTGKNPFIKEHLWKEIERSTENHIRQYLRPGHKILDVGVGTGRLLSCFPEAERYGLDVSHEYLLLAQKQGIEVCLARIEDFPYPPNIFDLVVCTDVLEHVLDLNLALERILFGLKSNGILIVRVPYLEDLSSYLAPEYPYDLVHLRTFDRYGLPLIIEKVFRYQTLASSLTGYTGGRPRIPIPRLFRIRSAFVRLLNLNRHFNPKIAHLFSKLLRKPTEINFVFRKSTSDTG